MQQFEFHPELFEKRALAIEALSKAGFEWFSDYSAVDLRHDGYGIEVCGIEDKTKALQILSVLQIIFPDWNYDHMQEQERGLPDAGWWVSIQRDKKAVRDSWRE
jgi:hypothetical protein